MLARVNRLALAFTAVFAVNLLLTHLGSQSVLAQMPTDSSSPSIEELLRRMDAMQQELDYLRGQSTQSPSVDPSPKAQMRFASLSTGENDSGCDGNACCESPAGCDGMGNCGGCQTSRCGCYPCQCGQCPAPCIDCPRVSTLNPYFNVNIFGSLVLDMLFSDARAVAPGTPYFLLPGPFPGLDQNTASLHGRQSSIGAVLTGPRIGNFQAGGTFLAFLYNDNALADAYGILPMQAFGELRNQDWRFAAGYQFDVFNPSVPTVLPFSILSGSGNTGNAARGQVRVERFLNPQPGAQWTLTFALSEPISTVVDPTFGLTEDNGWPNIEGRIALGLGAVQGQGAAAKRPFEVGVSGIVGQVRNTVLDPNNLTINRFVADVWGVGADVRWQMNDFFGVMGEFYTGEGLGTYNGAVLQLVNVENNFQSIQATGGWLEFFLYWTPCLHSHFGYGIDDPRDSDVAFAPTLLGRVENSTVYTNVLYDVTQSFRVAFELSWRETEYRNPIVPDNDGVFFHTQFMWSF